MSFPGLMRLRLSCDSRRLEVRRTNTQLKNEPSTVQHPETTVKSMALFHAYLDVCNWSKYVDDLRTPGPGAVLEFVSLLPGRTEAKIGNGWTFPYLETRAASKFWCWSSKTVFHLIAAEISGMRRYLGSKYGFRFGVGMRRFCQWLHRFCPWLRRPCPCRISIAPFLWNCAMFSTLRHSCGLAPDFFVGWECARNFGYMSL